MSDFTAVVIHSESLTLKKGI